jgi:hypothetical protein
MIRSVAGRLKAAKPGPVWLDSSLVTNLTRDVVTIVTHSAGQRRHDAPCEFRDCRG